MKQKKSFIVTKSRENNLYPTISYEHQFFLTLLNCMVNIFAIFWKFHRVICKGKVIFDTPNSCNSEWS